VDHNTDLSQFRDAHGYFWDGPFFNIEIKFIFVATTFIEAFIIALLRGMHLAGGRPVRCASPFWKGLQGSLIGTSWFVWFLVQTKLLPSSLSLDIVTTSLHLRLMAGCLSGNCVRVDGIISSSESKISYGSPCAPDIFATGREYRYPTEFLLNQDRKCCVVCVAPTRKPEGNRFANSGGEKERHPVQLKS
jgi:hypothetical protein